MATVKLAFCVTLSACLSSRLITNMFKYGSEYLKPKWLKQYNRSCHSPTRSKYTAFKEYYRCAPNALPRFALECGQIFDDSLYSICQYEYMFENKSSIYCIQHMDKAKRGQRWRLLSKQVLYHRKYSVLYSAFANSCPLQTDTFRFPWHNILLTSNTFQWCNERLGR